MATTESARIDVLGEKLDALAKAIAQAHDDLTEAEEHWDEVRDQAFEDLKQEMVEDDRKGDPAEHAVVSLARRRDREAYRAWRRCKREVAKLEEVAQNRRAEMSGRQTALREGGGGERKTEREGTRGLPQHAQRRAAA